MKQTQRHNGIIELVKQQGYVSTEELVEHFSVSPQTIRRDLNELAEQNLILRHPARRYRHVDAVWSCKRRVYRGAGIS